MNPSGGFFFFSRGNPGLWSWRAILLLWSSGRPASLSSGWETSKVDSSTDVRTIPCSANVADAVQSSTAGSPLGPAPSASYPLDPLSGAQ